MDLGNGSLHNQYLTIWNGHGVHPGYGYNAVVAFTAPSNGVLDFTSYFRVYNVANDGNNIRIMRGQEQIYPAGYEWEFVGLNAPLEVALTNMNVTKGEVFYIIVNCYGANAHDWVYMNPQFRYTSYEAEPDQVTLDKTNVSLKVGEYITLTPTITPADSMGKALTWTSSDESVATVSEYGFVTAVKAGTATVRVEMEGGAYAECVVTVTAGATGGNGGGNKTEKSGCGGSVSASLIGATTLLAAAFAIMKKREQNN